MTAPSVERPRRPRPPRKPASVQPDLDPPAVRALLQSAVEEAARLLDAEGAFLYRLDEARGVLRFEYDAGVQDLGTRPWVRRLELAVGTGMFGKAVAERRVLITGDYPNDKQFVHAKGPDRIVREADIRSLVVAPLQASGRVYGALGTFSSRPDAFTAPQIALVRALAEHAAASLANQALITELDRSREDVARRAEAERTLREIGQRLSAAREPAEVVQRAVDEALRLLAGDGARIDLIDPRLNLLRGAYVGGAEPPDPSVWPDDPDERLDEGVSGKAVATGQTFRTGDYLHDTRFVHGKGPDGYVDRTAIHSAIASPLVGEDGPIGALTVWSHRPEAFDEAHEALLETIAGQAAVALGRARLIEQLGRSQQALQGRAETERTLRELAQRIVEIRDPSLVLEQVIEDASRLVGGDGATIDLTGGSAEREGWAYDTATTDSGRAMMARIGVDPDMGLSGRALATGRVQISEDYLEDATFRHDELRDTTAQEIGIRGAIAVPFKAGRRDGVILVWSKRPSAFGPAEADTLIALGSLAGIAVANAALIEDLGESREQLARRAEQEQSLREIGGRLSAIDDPDDVLQRIVGEMRRLLGAERCRLDLAEPVGGKVLWTDPIGMLLHDNASIPMGRPEDAKGLTGMAIREDRAIVSGDYLADDRFEHYPEADREARELGLTSIVVIPVSGDAGLLGVLQAAHQAKDAFRDQELRLIETLASQAAIAITNAHLVDRLATSQGALARKVDTERALREIAARITVIREPGEVLQAIVDEARRLIPSDSARIDLVDEASGALVWEYGSGGFGTTDDEPRFRSARMTDEQGLSGLAIQTRQPQFTGDYLADPRFRHTDDIDAYVKAAGVHSILAVPLLGEKGAFGALYVVARPREAFDDRDAEILAALASQASIAITNARLVQQLGTSERQLSRTAAIERSIREIAQRTASMRDPREVLEHVTAEAYRLLDASMAIIDLNEPDGSMSWGYDVGVPEGGREAWYAEGLGDHGSELSMATRKPVVSPDYAADPRFEAAAHAAWLDRFGVHSWAAAPLLAENEVMGTLSVLSPEIGKWDEADGQLLQALADGAAVATTNARLIDALGQSKEELADRAEAERSLREIAARLTAIREPRLVLQLIVDEARRLAGSDAAFLDLLDPATAELRFEVASPATVSRPDAADAAIPSGEGIAGLAISQRASQRSGDILTDDRFHYPEAAHAIVRETGIRSVVAVPLLAEGTALGTISIASRQADAFEEADEEQLAALANQAAIAIRNAELVRELGRSREESARRADTERTLRELAARITAIRDPEAILGLIVEEARRVLGSDGAHLTRLADDESFLRPVVVAGGLDSDTRTWLMGLRFPLDGGINGLAAAQGRVVSTPDYRMDPRIPREPDDIMVAERLGLGAMAAAPLRAPGGDVIGTLAVNYRVPGRIAPERLDVLQALADHAAIAVWNSDLLQRLEESEHSYRRLVQTSPDVVWQTDADGNFTFLADDVVRLLGFTAVELVGTHFAEVIAEDSRQDAMFAFERPSQDRQPLRVKVDLVRKDGSVVPAEIAAVGIFEDEAFVGGQGTVRDVSERERLERELRESEARFRNLVENSPDLVWEIDLDGRFTYVSDSSERLLGVPAADMLGRPSSDWIDAGSLSAMFRIGSVIDDPHQVVRTTLTMIARSGDRIPFDIRATGLFRDGRLVGVHGASRDVSERTRLERELRESERRFRFLIENSPDVIWSLDAEGRFSFITDSVERATGWTASAFLGKPFEDFTDPTTLPVVHAAIESLRVDPDQRHVVRIGIPRPDGTIAPTELSFVGMTDATGAFAGVQGSSRDVSERERLEAELRESESRYRSLVQSSPDLIFAMDGQGVYTFFSDRAEELTGWSPEELIGRQFGEVVDMATFPNAAEEFARFAQEPGRPSTSRISLRHKDGHLVPFEVSALGQVDEGELVAVRGVARDISERVRLEKELQGSEARYRYLVQSSPDLVWVTDEEGRFTFVSDTALQILGLTPEEMVGRSFDDLAPEGTARNAVARFRWLQRHPTRVHRSQLPVLARDGRVITMEITGVGMLEEGRFVGAHGAARDISERERLERELRESESRYRYLVRASPDVVWEVSPEGKITFMSDRIEALTGWQPIDIIGRDFSFLMTDDSIRASASTWTAVREDPSAVYPLQIAMPSRWGEAIPVEVWLTGRVEDGAFVGAHGSIRDLRDRERLERDLRNQAAELASGEERAHLARELHDSVTQALFSMTLLSRSIELLLVKDPSQVPAKLAALRDLQKDALAEMRALIFELRPGNVEESGLIGALKTHTAGLAGRIGLPVVLDADLDARPPIEVEETLYRIAQEALHNTVKHAGAHQVRLEVSRVADGVRLRVSDDGRGFDPSAVPDGHLGLAGMRARAEKLGGRIAVKSALGQGTTIEVVVPEEVVAPS